MSPVKEKPIIWTKSEKCPLCETEFEVENVWTNRVKFSETYTDMAKKYIDINPLIYEIWVCPECLYAAYRKESFLDSSGITRNNFIKNVDLCRKLARGCDFHQPRTYELGIVSFKLGLLTLQEKPQVSAARYAMFFTRLAWLYRWKDNKEEEMRYLKLALSRYEDAYTKELSPEIGSIGETGLVYTIAEMYRRLGHTQKACEYFMKVITDKKMTGDPQYIRMARDMLSFAKEGEHVEFLK